MVLFRRVEALTRSPTVAHGPVHPAAGVGRAVDSDMCTTRDDGEPCPDACTGLPPAHGLPLKAPDGSAAEDMEPDNVDVNRACRWSPTRASACRTRLRLGRTVVVTHQPSVGCLIF